MMEESILQREVENNFDVLRKINALWNVKEIKDKWRNLTSKAKSAFTEYRRMVVMVFNDTFNIISAMS